MIAVNFTKKMILIGGTSYAGEMKKSVFTIMNYLLPAKRVMSMHCSANVGADGKSAIFFGLSGTGKTTLSADASRTLVGDDEHGWSEHGVFNIEGGCYAKVIKLSPRSRAGNLLHHRTLRHRAGKCGDGRGRPARWTWTSAKYAENTRAAYPIDYIPNASRDRPRRPSQECDHADGGCLRRAAADLAADPQPGHVSLPVRLHRQGGGHGKGPGQGAAADFLHLLRRALHAAPSVRIWQPAARPDRRSIGADCWLVNTGWTGGAFGTGSRMPIKATRALLNAALDGSLANVEMRIDPHFKFRVPVAVPGVDAKILNPRDTWADKAAYDAQARKLVAMFRENFKKFEAHVGPDVLQAAPELAEAAE